VKLDAIYEARACACGVKQAGDPAPPASSSEGGCRPWLRVERDEARYEACMAIAEKIGPVDQPRRAFEILSQAVGAEDQEVFGALYLDTHLRVRGLAVTARGEIDSTPAPIAPTLRIAVHEGAQGVLVFHVHPTLHSRPSDADRQVTLAFNDACATLNLLLVDHMIIGGRKEYYSFLEHGVLR
jgi:DNA repair protein RadC